MNKPEMVLLVIGVICGCLLLNGIIDFVIKRSKTKNKHGKWYEWK